mmetsp:Transcript_17632/g.30371  ORF Transcript_17632/g.30371 Transcript_17632/m.30371 type:complete len:359 (-) Transcript_17632:303-1379(-)|eukprot:CAMPEP_0196665436 /NCGR_PEP_ID=MMETSP1086-20130531/61127_1 /TAXON_ID=77921 /ORGANISM="Cyanoptyche  gloeocystis , Strain SAG4.97" /LENGTH=358 /DNA_ID=CAMNT_0042002201 /DNA_START=85 /DNA_END=1161 /DNA_ORIENTATION=+
MNVITQAAAGNQKKVPAVPGEGQSQRLVTKQQKGLISDDSGCCVFRRRVYALLDDPSSSIWAKIISVWIMFLIFLSCGAFIFKTLPIYYHDSSPIWDIIEAFSIINFTIEYVVKLLCCPNLFRFLIAPLNVIDIVAIVPFYIEIAVGSGGAGFAFIRILRLARIFRLFKLSRYSTGLQILGKTMVASLYPLGLLSFFLAIAVVIFSCVIYIAEAGEWSDEMGTFVRPDGSKSPFDSIPASFWWCVITMTTVGYGDVFPITITGKIVAAVTAICGILVLALPITVIGNNFTAQWATLNSKEEPAPEEEAEELIIAVSSGPTSAKQAKHAQKKLAELEEKLAKFQNEQQKLISQLKRELW